MKDLFVRLLKKAFTVKKRQESVIDRDDIVALTDELIILKATLAYLRQEVEHLKEVSSLLIMANPNIVISEQPGPEDALPSGTLDDRILN